MAILEDCDEKGFPKPFSISFCTANESAGTGGEIIKYERAIWHVKGGRVRRSAGFERTVGARGEEAVSHFTRNIRAVDSDQIRRLDIHLIMVINGHAVR